MALGSASGVTTPCYLASVGFFQAKFRSEALFGAQVAAVVLAHFGALLAEDCASSGERPSQRFLQRRLVLLCLASAAALLRTPGCGSEAEALFTGAIVSALGTWLFTASKEIGDLVGGASYVSAGFGLGSFAATLLVSICGFGPTSGSRSAYAFYGAGAAICVAGPLLWLRTVGFCRCLLPGGAKPGCCGGGEDASAGASEDAEDDELWDEEAEPSETRPLHIRREEGEPDLGPGYRTLAAAGRGDGGGAANASEASPELATGGATSSAAISAVGSALCAAGLFVFLSTGFVLLPLFPLAGPGKAVLLHQMKCLGDGLGRLAAVLRASECAEAGKVGCGTRFSLVVTAALRLMAALLVVAWLLAAQSRREGRDHSAAVAPEWLVLLLMVGVFCFGGYGVFMLDLDARLSAVGPGGRRSAQQWNRVAMILGSLVGLALGLAIVLK